MAITASRIDGQTLGFSLTAPTTTVDVLSLDIASGAVTSAYLTDTDIINLKPAVEALFALVPSAQRAAGALGMLQRLITIAPAAAANLTQSAVNTAGTVYALRGTISASPSQIIAHLPFSADGQLAWATGTGGSSLAVPVSLANGGTSTNLSGASTQHGAFFYDGAAGSASFAPLPLVVNPISTNPSPASTPKANPITVNPEVKNGNVYYDTAMNVLIQGQILAAGGAVALTDLTLTATVGQILPAADFSLTAAQEAAYVAAGLTPPPGSGRFIVVTAGLGPNAGKASFTVQTDKVTPGGVAGTLFLFLGPGPGSDVISGARTQLVYT